MSGGVDSSVAAALLLREGFEVVGCFMRLGSPGESLDVLETCDVAPRDTPLKIGHQGCCSINDAADARLVAAQLEIPFYVVNFKKEFNRIIDYFVQEYDNGRTPNPCVRCNDWLKFGRLHEYAEQIGAGFIASGHYARVDRDRHLLMRGVDAEKDQSYVLFGTPRAQLASMLLPIGGYTKPEIRDLARAFVLPVFDKPDSQEICFVPDNDYAGLVARRTERGIEPGRILDRDGNQLGEHPGHQHFTIGQRRGIGIAGSQPLYVINRNAEANTITVGQREQLQASGCIATNTNWLAASPSPQWMRCMLKIRYNAQPVPGQMRAIDADGSSLEVRFDTPQLAVAPGQAVVCYSDEPEASVVLCGGWIDRAT